MSLKPIKKTNILFFCPIPPPIGGQALISQIVYKLIRPSYLIDTNSKNKYLDSLLVISKCFWFLFFYKVDLVYFTCTRSKKGAVKDVVLLALCKLRGIKVINHLHGNEVMDLFTGGLMSKIILWSYKQIDTTIFVTERQKSLIPPTLKRMKRVVVPNCYDPVLKDINRDFTKEKKGVAILYISFLMKSKGIFVALDVFELIAKEYKDVIFHIAGKSLSDYLMTELETKELFNNKFQQLDNKFPNRFLYHGVVEGEHKKELFLSNDILLFPTFFKTESFGLVNVEAMRTGNAVITTDHNFLSDIVTVKEGLLVKPNDVEDGYLAVKYFLDNPDIRINIQRHNIEHAKEHYSPDRFKKDIKAIFSQS
jgi:glycosyltransferase involved in cell wall biosynthesis